MQTRNCFFSLGSPLLVGRVRGESVRQTCSWWNLKGSVLRKEVNMQYLLNFFFIFILLLSSLIQFFYNTLQYSTYWWYWDVLSNWGRRATNRLGPWKGLSNFGKPCHLLSCYAKIDSGIYANSPRLSGSHPYAGRISHSHKSHQISWIKHIKLHKMHLSDIFWPILEISGGKFYVWWIFKI